MLGFLRHCASLIIQSSLSLVLSQTLFYVIIASIWGNITSSERRRDLAADLRER